jgi:peptidoglycan/LPS O-acetylase OafA/YrhL
MSISGTAQKRLEKFPAFDGFRGIGVLVVIFSHFPDVLDSAIYSAVWKINMASKVGYVMLDIFFAMSGFFITRLLLRERAATGRISFRDFYTRRALRIFPVYYLTIVVCFFVFNFQWADTLSLLSYTFNFYHPFNLAPHPLEHTWSLSVEEQFYFFWPLVILLVPPRLIERVTGRLIPLFAVASGFALAWTIGARDNALSGDLVYMSISTRMLSLSLGGWIAVREFQNRPLTGVPCLVLAIVALVLLVLDRVARETGVITNQGVYWTVALAAYGMISVSFVSTMVFDRGIFQRWLTAVLSLSILRSLGNISYALYVFHLPVLFAMGLNDGTLTGNRVTVAQAAMAFFVMMLLAIASYFVIERPLQSVKQKFSGDGRTPKRADTIPVPTTVA